MLRCTSPQTEKPINWTGLTVPPSKVKQTQKGSRNGIKVQSAAGPREAHFTCHCMQDWQCREKSNILSSLAGSMWSFCASSSIVCNYHHSWAPRVWRPRGKPHLPNYHPSSWELERSPCWFSRVCAVRVFHQRPKKGTVYADVRASCHLPSQPRQPSWPCGVPRSPCCSFSHPPPLSPSSSPQPE